MGEPTFERIGDIYRVCLNGMCRDHHQEWQALIFYHQMLNQSTCPDVLHRHLLEDQ